MQDSLENVTQGILLPIAIGAAYLAIAATVLGWWRPALREPSGRNLPRWLVIVPLPFTAGGVMGVVGTDFSAIDMTLILAIGAGVLLVPFSDELSSRGLLIVGARGSMPDWAAWPITRLMFGLRHAINAFLGEDGGLTGGQVLAAFLAGGVFSTTRCADGLLVIPTLMHAAWTWGSRSSSSRDTAHPAPPTQGCSGQAAPAPAPLTMRRRSIYDSREYTSR